MLQEIVMALWAVLALLLYKAMMYKRCMGTHLLAGGLAPLHYKAMLQM
jgi:hypothetical protein